MSILVDENTQLIVQGITGREGRFQTAQMISSAVTLLPPQQRAVVVLRIWHGLPYADIAEMVDCTEGTVRSHMHHGLATLRKHLERRL